MTTLPLSHVQPDPKKFMLFDEASLLFADQHARDRIRDELLQCPIVPDAAYVVEDDGSVFVFEKLVSLVEPERAAGALVADVVERLLPQARMTAAEAVRDGKIVPWPYEVRGAPGGGFMIYHRRLNARIPGDFVHADEANDALCSLLLGGVVPGRGDFTFRGQPMTLCESLALDQLPAAPAIPEGPGAAHFRLPHLEDAQFVAGFPPVSGETFQQVKAMKLGWAQGSSQIMSWLSENSAAVWEHAHVLPLDRLNGSRGDVDEPEQVTSLRAVYPELQALSDVALYEHFDWYQMDCYGISCWSASRSDGFLLYLAGRLADPACHGRDSTEVGSWALYALLHGAEVDEALRTGCSAGRYSIALHSLAWRISDALQFVSQEPEGPRPRGPRIATFNRMFGRVRKYSGDSLLITSTPDDGASAETLRPQ